jgi:hypothetical protein
VLLTLSALGGLLSRALGPFPAAAVAYAPGTAGAVARALVLLLAARPLSGPALRRVARALRVPRALSQLASLAAAAAARAQPFAPAAASALAAAAAVRSAAAPIGQYGARRFPLAESVPMGSSNVGGAAAALRVRTRVFLIDTTAPLGETPAADAEKSAATREPRFAAGKATQPIPAGACLASARAVFGGRFTEATLAAAADTRLPVDLCGGRERATPPLAGVLNGEALGRQGDARMHWCAPSLRGSLVSLDILDWLCLAGPPALLALLPAVPADGDSAASSAPSVKHRVTLILQRILYRLLGRVPTSAYGFRCVYSAGHLDFAEDKPAPALAVSLQDVIVAVVGSNCRATLFGSHKEGAVFEALTQCEHTALAFATPTPLQTSAAAMAVRFPRLQTSAAILRTGGAQIEALLRPGVTHIAVDAHIRTSPSSSKWVTNIKGPKEALATIQDAFRLLRALLISARHVTSGVSDILALTPVPVVVSAQLWTTSSANNFTAAIDMAPSSLITF